MVKTPIRTGALLLAVAGLVACSSSGNPRPSNDASAAFDAGGPLADMALDDAAAPPCVSGRVDTLAAVNNATGLALFGSRLAVSQLSGSTVLVVPTSGGAGITLGTGGGQGINQPSGIALDANNVYWADQNSGYIAAAPADGSSRLALVAGANRQTLSMAVDSTTLFWIDQSNLYAAGAKSGAPSTLDMGSGLGDIALDANNVYVAAYGKVQAVPKRGGAAQTIYSGGGNLVSLALDATDVFFAQLDNSTHTLSIAKVAKTGGPSSPVVSTPTGTSGWIYPQIAVDDAYVYFGVGEQGQLMRAPKAGGAATTIVPNLTSAVTDLQVDQTAVYFATRAALLRYCK